MHNQKYLEFQDYYSNHLRYSHSNTKGDYAVQNRYFKKNYLKYLPTDREASILEIGCGAGHFLCFLKQQGYQQVSGIDVSAECVAICRKLGFLQNGDVQHVDATTFLKNSGRNFDCIIMNDVIEHLPKNEIVDTLRIIRSRLSTGGILILKTPNMANPIMAASGRYSDFTHSVGFTEESMAQVLQLAGFSNFKLLPQDIWVFDPITNLIGKLAHRLFSWIFLVLFLGFGRASTRIFSKDLIAVVRV